MWKKLDHKSYPALLAVASSLHFGQEGLLNNDMDVEAAEQNYDVQNDELKPRHSTQVELVPEVEQAYLARLRDRKEKGKIKHLPVECKVLSIHPTKKEKTPLIAFLLNWVSENQVY